MRLTADDLDGLEAPLPRQRLRSRRVRGLPWLRVGIVCAAMVLALAHLAGPPPPAPAPEPGAVPLAPLIAPPPTWQLVHGPAPLYAIEGVDAGSFGLEVRRHVAGGREDTLAFGSFGEAGYGRLQATVGPTEPEAASFYVDLARHTARAGVSVVRSTQAAPLTTKFGAAEVAEVTLAGASEVAGASEEACLSFRIARPGSGFALRGWVCGAEGRAPGGAQVACLIDRLALEGAGDPALERVFAEAERHRLAGCAAPRPQAAVTGAETASAGERAASPARGSRPARARR